MKKRFDTCESKASSYESEPVVLHRWRFERWNSALIFESPKLEDASCKDFKDRWQSIDVVTDIVSPVPSTFAGLMFLALTGSCGQVMGGVVCAFSCISSKVPYPSSVASYINSRQHTR